jgi:hypothetical protein
MNQCYRKFGSHHQGLSRLLPWHANKTLQGAELKKVDRHVSVCLTCKRELSHYQKLAQAVIKESAPRSPEQAAFLRLKRRLMTKNGRDEAGVGNTALLFDC